MKGVELHLLSPFQVIKRSGFYISAKLSSSESSIREHTDLSCPRRSITVFVLYPSNWWQRSFYFFSIGNRIFLSSDSNFFSFFRTVTLDSLRRFSVQIVIWKQGCWAKYINSNILRCIKVHAMTFLHDITEFQVTVRSYIWTALLNVINY